MASLSIHSVPSQEDAAASEQSSGDFIAELQEMFAPYHAAYDETMRTVELSRATVYQLAIKLAHEIYERLTLAKTGSIFAKNMIQNLWCLTTARVYEEEEDDDDEEEFDPDVNVVSIVYDFLTICGTYPDAPFAATTFGLATLRKKGKYDPNYDTSFQKAKVPLNESKFVDIFRAFRSIVARIVKNSTGSYDIPEKAYSQEWGYSFQNAKGAWSRSSCTPEFEAFILEIAPVYGQLEKFTPELKEVFEVFNNASAAAKAHRAERDAKRAARNNARDMRAMREKHDRRRPRPAKTAPVVAKPEPRPFVEAPHVACRWGKVNPITGAVLPAAAPAAPVAAVPAATLPALIEEPREVATDGEGEFQVVARQQKRNERTRNWQQRSQPADGVTPRVQHRMDRARAWREKQANAQGK